MNQLHFLVLNFYTFVKKWMNKSIVLRWKTSYHTSKYLIRKKVKNNHHTNIKYITKQFKIEQ